MFNLRAVDQVKQQLKQSLLATSKQVWRIPLDRRQSIEMLSDAIFYKKQHPSLKLPTLQSLKGEPSRYFPTDKIISFEPDFVWKISTDNSPINSLKTCTSGNVLVNGKYLLDLDFRVSGAGILEFPYKPKQIQYSTIVAPWSHLWCSYYDFVIFVLAKLCRIEYVFGTEIWQEAKICYPLLHTKFEQEYLAKLGIPQSSLLDTRSWEVGYHADSMIVGNNQDWYYPSPYDISLLRNKFALRETSTPYRRLYLSRKGRRRVKNEAEVRAILKKFDFEIVEDVERSIEEQIRLFNEAAIIVGPHGAGFTNILWCQPGTKVFEFFYGGYTPPYFYYLSQLLGLDYSYLVEDINSPEDWSHIGVDLKVDTEVLRKKLQKMLD